MDVGALLREVLAEQGWSLSELAARGGTSRSTLSAYLDGSVSPSVRTLDRLLAAGGRQARATLEPLWADLDAQVAGLLSGEASLDVDAVLRLVERAALEQNWAVEDLATGDVSRVSGRMSWAFDGATALGLQGLSLHHDPVAAVLRFDDAARAWLTRGLMRGTAPGEVVGWWSCSLEAASRMTREFVVGGHGFLRIRLVEELPRIVYVQVPGSELCVPTVTVDEVECSHPELAAVLGRLRARRAAGLRT